MEFLTTYNDDGEEVRIPARFEVCWDCDGRGSSSAHLGAFSPDDEYMRDDDFREAYFAGRFDRACGTCGGKRVVLEPDEFRATDEQMRWWESERRAEAEARAIQAAEMRFGC